MPSQIAGYKRIGPIAVDAGWVVKVLNDAVGNDNAGGGESAAAAAGAAAGEWWHVLV